MTPNTYLLGYWEVRKYCKEFRNDMICMFNVGGILSSACKSQITDESVTAHFHRGYYEQIGSCI